MQPAPTRKNRKKRMRLPNGVGSVHKIGDSKSRRNPWRARFPSHVELNTETGKAVQKYITIGYYPTEVEAIAALMEYRKNPYTLEAATCTFEDVFQMWKREKYPQVSASAQGGYNAAYKHSASLYKMKMREINASHLKYAMQNVDGGFELQAKIKTLWGQLFKYGIENDLVDKNYAQFVTTRDPKPETKRTAFSPDDIAKVWSAIDAGDHDAELAMIYIYTGLRASELLEIEKTNVDLSSRIMIGGKKTKAGTDRRIPIHSCILPFIERLMAQPGQFLVMREDVPNKSFTYSRFSLYSWQPLMERLGMNYTAHETRHTCATLMREAGVEDDLRKLILGHANGDITARYTHITDSMLVEAIDKLPGRN